MRIQQRRQKQSYPLKILESLRILDLVSELGPERKAGLWLIRTKAAIKTAVEKEGDTVLAGTRQDGNLCARREQ